MFVRRVTSSLLVGTAVAASSASLLVGHHSSVLVTTMRRKGDFGFNIFHNSNPQHGGAYARHERKMRDDEFEDFLLSVKGWDHDPDTQSIWRSFYFDNFNDAYMFMGKFYAFCYGSDKYPHVTWDNTRVDVHLYSPTFKGLSKREACIAAFMNDQYNVMRKTKQQRDRLLELASESVAAECVGDAPASAAENDAARHPPLPESQRGLKWSDIVN